MVLLCQINSFIIQLCKHVVAKVKLVPCSVNLTGKRDKVGHGEVTINNARIIAWFPIYGTYANRCGATEALAILFAQKNPPKTKIEICS